MVDTLSAEELRDAITADLDVAGIRAYDYTSPNLIPPCASVVPAQPYVRKPVGDEPGAAVFGVLRVGFDVLLVTGIDTPEKTAQRADALIWQAWAALRGWRPSEVARPAEIEIAGSKFMGSVMTITHDTKEPV